MPNDNPLYPMIEECVGFNGRSTDPTVREETTKRLMPNDPYADAENYLYGMVINGKLEVPNTCALQALDAFRTYYGVTGLPEVDRHYIGVYDAVARVERLGAKLGVIDTACTELPEPGDFVRSGDFPHEHVSCIADYDAATGDFITVDGGQGQGSETKLVRRKVVVDRGLLYLVNAETPWVKDQRGHEYANGKPIRRILRMKKMVPQ